jgi:hypothetical protein
MERSEPTTDSIINGLRFIADTNGCNENFCYECSTEADKDCEYRALRNSINRLESQQREIELLEHTLKNGFAVSEHHTMAELQAENERLTAERDAEKARADAAVKDLERFGKNVHTCWLGGQCSFVDFDHASCIDCTSWQWRGAQEGEE